ncbi:MAG TPA: M20 family metallopeptidase [Anaerolineae bacterium]|nr:M20 family metallopeptidase [Anaerolineae bacterium]
MATSEGWSVSVVERLLAYLHDQQEPMADLLRRLALAESPSLEGAAQQPVFDLLAERLAALDFAVQRVPGRLTGGVLYARPQARQRGAPVQLLLCHGDTVWPAGALATMPVTRDGNRLSGPGVFDMKGGLVLMVYALQALHVLGLQPSVTPVVLVNSDEEIGSPESTRHIRRLAQAAARVFVLEPGFGPQGHLKTARKGVLRFDVFVQGKAAHAGLAPQEGVSAILALAHLIQQLHALNDWEHGISVNVGQISGGTRPNVVAHEARAVVDVRVPTVVEADRISAALLGLQAALPGAQVMVEQVSSSLPLEPTPRNQRLWQQAQTVGQLLGLELEAVAVGGASDGNTTSQFTATLDGLGPIGDGAHAAHEYVLVDRLPERAALLALLLLSEM